MGGRDRLNGGHGLAAALCILPLLAAPSPAAAQAPAAAPASPQAAKPKPARPRTPRPEAEDDTEVSEVVVSAAPNVYQTLPGALVGDITPELELSPADIQSYGVSTVTELLDELAPETRSDRGRGGETPVVLLNGRRISGFNEIRDIPTEAVLRVDILPEEVALKYGFTADQRVVNIVLRRRFRAVTDELQGGGPTEGGQVSGKAEADVFRVRGDNRLNIDVQYSGASDLLQGARGLTSSPSGQPYATAGNVVPASGALEIDPALSALAGRTVTVAGAPVLPAGRGLLLSDFLPTAGVANTDNLGQDRDLSPASQTVSANAVLARTLPAGFSGTINGTLGATGSTSLQGLPGLGLTAPAGDPFSPFGQAVRVDRYAQGLGPLSQSTTGWTGHLGGTLNKDLGRWRLSFTSAYDHADSLTEGGAGIDSAPLQALLNAASASFNPFAPLSRSMLTLLPNNEARSVSDSGNVQFLANGPLIRLPAGPLQATIKVGDSDSAFASRSERMGLVQSVSLSRNDANAQLNMDLPLTSRRNKVLDFMGNLSINGNIAADRISGFGTLTTLGYGLNWQPVDALRLIVSHTRDEAAPTVQQLGNPTVQTPGVRLFDYATGRTVDVTQIIGANPALTEDHRNVFKVGLTLKPWSSQDFTLTANYIDARIDHPIQTFPAATAQIQAAFPARFIRDATGELVEEDIRPVNFDWSSRKEIRWGFNYSRPVGRQPPPRPPGGRFGPNGQGGPGAQGQARRRRQGDGPPPPDGGLAPPEGTPPPAPQQGAAPAPGQGAAAPGQQAQADARPGGGFGARGGGRGGGRGGFGGGGAPGAAAGRFQIAVYHTVFFVDQLQVAPGGPLLDLLNGAPSGAKGGQPVQQVEGQLGFTEDGWGARASANWVSGTTVAGSGLSPSGTLTFSDLATVNLRLFANLGQMRPLVMSHRWLSGTRVTVSLVNLFDARLRVRDGAGATPLSYQPAYLDPAGRTISLAVRKLFF